MADRRPLVMSAGRPVEMATADRFPVAFSPVPTGKVVWVDAVNGNDSTGVRQRADLPFLTLAAAVTAAASGDTVQVLPGSYTPTTNLHKAGVSWALSPGVVITNGRADGAYLWATSGSDALVVSGASALISGLAVSHASSGAAFVSLGIVTGGSAGNHSLFESTGSGSLNLRVEIASLTSGSGAVVRAAGSGSVTVNLESCSSSGRGLSHTSGKCYFEGNNLYGATAAVYSSTSYEDCEVAANVISGGVDAVSVAGNGLLTVRASLIYAATGKCVITGSAVYTLSIVCAQMECGASGMLGGIAGGEVTLSVGKYSAINKTSGEAFSVTGGVLHIVGGFIKSAVRGFSHSYGSTLRLFGVRGESTTGNFVSSGGELELNNCSLQSNGDTTVDLVYGGKYRISGSYIRAAGSFKALNIAAGYSFNASGSTFVRTSSYPAIGKSGGSNSQMYCHSPCAANSAKEYGVDIALGTLYEDTNVT